MTLEYIVKDLLLFFYANKSLSVARKEIEKKCNIKKEPEHKCWSEYYIKQAWEETIKMDKKSIERRHRTLVIMLQIVRRLFCDTCKQNAAQKNRHGTTDEQDCEMRRNPEDRSSRSKAELETAGAAGGDEQRIKKVSEASKLLDDSAAASASRLSASSTDEAVIQALSKSRQMNKKDRPAESSAALRRKEAAAKAAGGVKKQTTKRNQGQTGVSQGQSLLTQLPSSRKSKKGSEKEAVMLKKHETTYIRIPFSELFNSEANEPHKLPQKTTKSETKYKLIDSPPQFVKTTETNINKPLKQTKKKRFYVMSYNDKTKNAKWVYEILNISTLPSYYKKPEFKYSDSDSDSDDPTYKLTTCSKPCENPDYDRGHLAAAANHTWCQEAYEKTFSMRNITPQNKILNRGIWKKLEEFCRKKVRNDEVHNVHVYSGPLYLKGESTDNGKAVPSDYFKVVIVEKVGGEVELECYVMPNSESEKQDKNLNLNKTRNNEANNDWLKDYTVDIKFIEEKTGLKFTEDCCELDGVDQKKSGKWLGNNGKKEVTIDVTISSCKKNPLLNEE